MTESDKPRRRPHAPAGLDRGGHLLWHAITRAYDLRPDELVVLRHACFEVDLVDRLEEELRGSPLIVKGSMGQEAASPLVMELRLHRTTLAGLLKQLKLPDQAGQGGDGRRSWDRSVNARRAARARWGSPSA